MFDISPAEWTAILLSLRVAVIATLVATPFGIALAWLLARRDFWGKSVLDALVHLPLVLPPVVTGYLLLLTFGRRVARRSSRHRVRVPLDRRGARLRRDVLSIAGPSHPPLDRGDRPQVRAGRLDPGRGTLAGFRDRDPAAGIARHPRRHGARLCQG